MRADPSALGRLPVARRSNLESGREALDAYSANKDRVNEQFTAIKSGLDRQKELREAGVATIDQAALEGQYTVATSTGVNATRQIAPAFTVESDLKDAYTASRSDDSEIYQKMHDVVDRFSESYSGQDTSVSARFEFADAFKTPPDVAAAALPSSIVDARNVPSGLPKFVEDALPHTPAGDDLRKGYESIQDHNWKAALAWFRTAQNRDPSDAGIARVVGLAEYMNARQNGARPASDSSSSPTVPPLSGRDGPVVPSPVVSSPVVSSPVVSRPPVTAADRAQLDKMLDMMEDDLTRRALEFNPSGSNSKPTQNPPGASGGAPRAPDPSSNSAVAGRGGPGVGVTAAERVQLDKLLDTMEDDLTRQAIEAIPSQNVPNASGGTMFERTSADPKFTAARDTIIADEERAEIQVRHKALQTFRNFLDSQGGDWVERLRNDKAFIARVDQRRDEIWAAQDREEVNARATGLAAMRDLVDQWDKAHPEPR